MTMMAIIILLLLMSMLLKKSGYELGMREENITNFTKAFFLG